MYNPNFSRYDPAFQESYEMVGCVHPCFFAFYVLFTRVTIKVLNLVENYLLHIFVLSLEDTDDCQINRTSFYNKLFTCGFRKEPEYFQKV